MDIVSDSALAEATGAATSASDAPAGLTDHLRTDLDADALRRLRDDIEKSLPRADWTW